ncbi:nicotinate-nucleotide--dimethylbenzimidazole phosphoribosyltransferase [Amylibacter marinus]|uniref:Nicotinate-nucleotide--dimethylbenzimidazole phosphoribosyltransferase n=1 Tax=Amylibacter marinus TaxID=1475483 RepID=A0ABQ5VY15_9RHOB|nr:nicotinate-nucleotide--dimethylbenzimidazole phosphoribosyltransferase [Amylibacter marinus]GLQ36034.1 nicotinate-nucleotide--dimethylbenzimidazole phosphoribosyltransferase [Amylibacter marinus]
MNSSLFNSLAEFADILGRQPNADADVALAAKERNEQLTKPPGALGRLEDLAIWFASWRRVAAPRITNPQVVVFAGNHGVTAQGVSAFPADVTAQMVANFRHGGAAINQLCQEFGASISAIDLNLDTPTGDFTKGPAMSEADCIYAIQTGWQAVNPEADVFVAGEMGIGNTTSAAAIALALYGGVGNDWVGAGTGVDAAGLATKAQVVEAGLEANPSARQNGLEALRCLGGRELAAIVGAIAAARAHSIPVILDGFICCAAAACLQHSAQNSLDHCVAGHQSNEQAHAALLAQLGKEPMLNLGLRLGEGSGAALALGVLRGAIACHSGMATFAEAGVSEGA